MANHRLFKSLFLSFLPALAWGCSLLFSCRPAFGAAYPGSTEQFLLQHDSYNAPVAPAAVLPDDFSNGRLFVPFSDTAPKKLAVGMNGVSRTYRLKALWLDKGCPMQVLEARDGLSEGAYIRRYGNGPVETRSIPKDVLYQGRSASVFLTEPEGFARYHWERQTTAGSWELLQSGSSAAYELKQTADHARYRCRVEIGAHSYVTGTDYQVALLKLGTIHGIQFEEKAS